MILEMVTFDRPEGADSAALLEDARHVIPRWQANPDLVQKFFATTEEGRMAGIYIWPDRAAARAGHDDAWIAAFRERTGAEPEFTYFDLFMEIDNAAGVVREFPLD